MKTCIRLLAAAIGALLACSAALGRTPDDPRLNMDPGIVKGKLPCGLSYYVYRSLRPAYKTNFYLLNNVGSTVEGPEELGMAHFIEHLAFDGTEHFPGNSLVSTLEGRGLSFGYDINAYTSHDATVYKICDVDSRLGDGLVDTCLLMLKDIAQGLTFEPAMVEKERAIIMEEWRQGNNAFARLTGKMFPILFGSDNPYCRMPIGTPATLMSFTPESLRQFYEHWYQPQHQAVMVIGYVDPYEVEQKIWETWGEGEGPAEPSRRKWAQIPNHEGLTAGVVTDEELPGSQMDFWFKVDIPPRSERDRLSYINSSYVGHLAYSIMRRRLGDMLYEPGTPFSGASAEFSQYYLADSKDAFRLYGLYDKTRRQEALQRLIAESKKAALYGVEQEEMQLALEAMRKVAEQVPTIFDEKNNYDHFDRISEHFLKGNVVLSPDDEQWTYECFTDTVTPEAVNAFLRRTLTPDNLTAILAEKETRDPTVPSSETLRRNILAMWDTVAVEPHKFDNAYLRPLIPNKLAPGKIVQSDFDTTFVAMRYRLDNGARVIVCRQTVLADEISLRAVQRGGESALLPIDFADGYHAATIADIGGLGDFSLIELSRKLSGTGVDIESNHTPYAEIIEGESRIDELETLLQLLHLRLTTVRSDSVAFANWLKTRRAHMLDLRNDPDNIFSDSIRSVLYGRGHPYMRRVEIADLDTLDFDNALRLYKQRLANPAALDFIIMGNVDFDAVEPLVEQYIGSLPGDGWAEREPFRRIDRLAHEGKRRVRFSVPMSSPFTRVYQAYELHRPYTLADEMALSLLESLLQRIYIQTLREEAAGTYTPNVGSTSGEVDGFHSLFFSFSTNAEAADGLLQTAIGAIEEIASNGPDEALFQATKDYLLNQEYVATLQQHYPMSVFTHLMLYGDMDAANRYQALKTVTPATLQTLARDLLAAPAQATIIMDGE